MTGSTPAHDADDPPARSEGEWVATVWADRDYHDLVRARQPRTAGPGDDVGFPGDHATFEVVLRGDEVRIGRRGAGSDPDPGTAPGIDLTGCTNSVQTVKAST